MRLAPPKVEVPIGSVGYRLASDGGAMGVVLSWWRQLRHPIDDRSTVTEIPVPIENEKKKLATAILTLKIPLTSMENNISDFTPYDARSRQELKIYREFFLNRGEPKTIYAFVSAKDGLNMLKTSYLNETVQNQLPNNIREIALIVLQFRAEIGSEVNIDDMKQYERSIVDYFQKEFKSDLISVNVLTDSFITSEIVRSGLTLLPFLVIGFVIMATFSSVTFSISATALKQMDIHKITLAIMACVCPFMACGATLGGMFWAGFRFGSILCVTPFLVLAIGVDDAYLMVNAWQRITSHRRKMPIDNVNVEVRRRVTEMLVETGPSVSITTITNVLAFGIGALTPTPEIQLFSIGNALAVVVDFIFQFLLCYQRSRSYKGKVADFENLPSSVGSYSTKFWLRDYEDFLRQAEELDVPEEFEEPDTAIEFSQNGRHVYESGVYKKGNLICEIAKRASPSEKNEIK
ncbi:patched family protein [Necator americanus]|uniref:Patched family protein n=1 Tax=Necator americanus TaxID=51031 RepID=W2SLK4_NECAM|nr:patched family protein [Necator americanus]ETN70549.1 patched family protein [Necator americanus]